MPLGACSWRFIRERPERAPSPFFCDLGSNPGISPQNPRYGPLIDCPPSVQRSCRLRRKPTEVTASRVKNSRVKKHSPEKLGRQMKPANQTARGYDNRRGPAAMTGASAPVAAAWYGKRIATPPALRQWSREPGRPLHLSPSGIASAIAMRAAQTPDSSRQPVTRTRDRSTGIRSGHELCCNKAIAQYEAAAQPMATAYSADPSGMGIAWTG